MNRSRAVLLPVGTARALGLYTSPSALHHRPSPHVAQILPARQEPDGVVRSWSWLVDEPQPDRDLHYTHA